MSHLGTGEAPADPSPWALSVLLLGVFTSALQSRNGGRPWAGTAGKLLVPTPTLRGTSSALCSILQLPGQNAQVISDKTFLSFAGSLSHLLALPCSPPAPGTLAGQLSGLETQELLSPLHAGDKQQAQEDTKGTSSLQCVMLSPTRCAPHRPCSLAGLGQGNELCPGGPGFNLQERRWAAACKHLTAV